MKRVAQNPDHQEEHSPYDAASLFARLTYTFVNPLLDVGEKKPLDQEDLYKLSRHDKAETLVAELEKHWLQELQAVSEGRKKEPSLWLAIYKSNTFEFYYSGLWTVLELAGMVGSPLLLGYFIDWLNDDTAEAWQGYAAAAGIAGCQFFRLVAHHILFFYTMRAGWNARVATTGLVHKKVLRLGCADLLEATTGRVVNLVANDVQRFDEFFVMLHFVWASPLALLAVLALVAREVGWLPAAMGVGTVLALIPTQARLGKWLSRLRAQTAEHTDARVRVTAEVLAGIASVKAFVWEDSFQQKISKIRDQETKVIAMSQLVKAVNLGIFLATPVLAAFVTFAVFWARGGRLSVALAVTTLSLVHALREVFGRLFTRGVETGAECRVAARRVARFLRIREISRKRTTAALKEEDESKVEDKDSDPADEEALMRFENASFSWTPASTEGEAPSSSIPLPGFAEQALDAEDSTPAVISNISFEARPGELVLVVGPVGCGKSALLAAALGEAHPLPGGGGPGGGGGGGPGAAAWQGVRPGARVAYVGQKPWIQAATFRQNVVGLSTSGGGGGGGDGGLDDPRYAETLRACCLTKDLRSFPAGDASEIGERGVNLSGGQKARCALARAAYSDADVYLLDDPLAAVDPEVAHKIFHRCLARHGGLLRRRGGDPGPGEEGGGGRGVRRPAPACVLVTHQVQFLAEADRVVVLDAGGRMAACGAPAELQRRGVDLGLLLAAEEEQEGTEKGEGGAPPPPERGRLCSRSSVASADGGGGGDGAGALTAAEERGVGQVTRATYLGYLRGAGTPLLLGTVVLMLVAQGAVMLSDYWLVYWAEQTDQGSKRGSHYFTVFSIIVAGSCVAGVLRGAAFFLCALRSARALHRGMLSRVLRCPVAFFLANPSGRVLNKFSKDQGNVDELLPPVLFDALQSGLFCLAAVGAVVASVYWVLFLVVPLVWLFFRLRRRFLASSREIRRLEAVARSPIYAEFSATLEGLQTLRAFGAEGPAHTHFLRLLDRNGQGWFCFILVSRWLGFRLDSQTAAFVAAACLLGAALKGSVDPGLLGFGIMYSFSLSGLLQWAVRQTAMVENFMTAVERILYYSALPSEKEGRDASALPPKGWPSSGALAVEGLAVRYREGLQDVLKDLTFQIPSGAKVGLVGRSGSGKSSLVLALLQLNQITAGKILVDGIDLSTIPISEARKKIGWIPQDPHLFSGDLRANLDPFDDFTDEQIWQALQEVNLKATLGAHPKGLKMQVQENGANLSVGQRQLLSLARALLLGNKILLMDEATANVDFQTDAIIQDTLRTRPAFRDRTVVVIAHRIRTIIDADRVLVLESGRLVEAGAPAALLRDCPNGPFAKMVASAGLPPSAAASARAPSSAGGGDEEAGGEGRAAAGERGGGAGVFSFSRLITGRKQ